METFVDYFLHQFFICHWNYVGFVTVRGFSFACKPRASTQFIPTYTTVSQHTFSILKIPNGVFQEYSFPRVYPESSRECWFEGQISLLVFLACSGTRSAHPWVLRRAQGNRLVGAITASARRTQLLWLIWQIPWVWRGGRGGAFLLIEFQNWKCANFLLCINALMLNKKYMNISKE